MKKQMIVGFTCVLVMMNISACSPFQSRKEQKEKETAVVVEKEEIEEAEEEEVKEELVEQEGVKTEEEPKKEEPKEEEPKKETPSNTNQSQGNSQTITVPTTIKYPLNLSHLSGVGAWSSDITIQADGSFSGSYSDADMGDTGEEYPNGTVYISGFSGRFTNIRKIDQYSYALTLESATLREPIGKVYIEDGVRYVCTGAAGLTKDDSKTPAKNFILYLPGTPMSMLTEDFKMWYDMCWGYGTNPTQILPMYGLRNLDTEDGFFG